MRCHFCKYDLSRFKGQKFKPTSTFYECPICGAIRLDKEASENISSAEFSENQKQILSIVLRNGYERRHHKPSETPATLDDLHRYLREYKPLRALEKLEYSFLRKPPPLSAKWYQ
jgi:hypothetical protein